MIPSSSAPARLSGKIDVDDFSQDREYSAVRAYGAAKLENFGFTQELHRRYRDEGISATAFHPGNVGSSFGNQTESRFVRAITQNPVLRRLAFVTPEQGADQLAWLATTEPGADWQPGAYSEKRKPAKRVNSQTPSLAR